MAVTVTAENPPPGRAGTRAADRLLLGATRRGGGWIALLALTTLVDAAATTILPLAIARAIDAVLVPGTPGAGAALALCAALIAVSAAADVGAELAAGSGTARATAWLRHRLGRHVLAVGPALRVPPGDAVARMVGGVAEAGTAPAAAVQAVTAIVPPVGALAVLAITDRPVALTIVVALPLIALLLRVFVRDIGRTAHRYLAVQAAIAARLAEALDGARTIAAARTADREERRVLGPLPELRAEGHAMWRVQGSVAARSLLTLMFLQVAVVAVAGLELMAGRIGPGQLVAAVQYAGLAAGFGPAVGHLMRLGRARAGAARAAGVLAEPPRTHGARALPPDGRGRLEFRDVAARDVLDGLHLTVPGGLAMAVVGRSGSGKSLLAGLAGRLADPDRGEVLLDGVPLRELSRDALRRAVGYAFARPVLLGDTVRDAIALDPGDDGDGNLGDDRIRAAATAARADDFIRKLPHGYRTRLADAPLSGGEAQRLGLARAFARPGRLLVLDDATSSLDTATELRITQALLGPLADRTRLIVAHRAATAARADLVAWLDGGRVRATGPHAELWRDPEYRAVFRTDAP